MDAHEGLLVGNSLRSDRAMRRCGYASSDIQFQPHVSPPTPYHLTPAITPAPRRKECTVVLAISLMVLKTGNEGQDAGNTVTLLASIQVKSWQSRSNLSYQSLLFLLVCSTQLGNLLPIPPLFQTTSSLQHGHKLKGCVTSSGKKFRTRTRRAHAAAHSPSYYCSYRLS